jgi:hypothetical protein
MNRQSQRHAGTARKSSWALAIGLGLSLLSQNADAQIVTYPISSSPGSVSSLAATGVSSHITASSISMVGLTPISFDQTLAASSAWPVGSFGPSQYFQFSVTPEAGYAVTYSTLSYSLFRTVIGANSNIKSWQLHASLDGFSSNDITLANNDLGTAGNTEMVLFNNNISALGTRSTQVTFRLYGRDDGNLGGGLAGLANRTSFSGTGSNVLLGGSVVPEAENMAVAAALGLIVFAFARHRHN